jgi:hypothetical protein
MLQNGVMIFCEELDEEKKKWKDFSTHLVSNNALTLPTKLISPPSHTNNTPSSLSIQEATPSAFHPPHEDANDTHSAHHAPHH